MADVYLRIPMVNDQPVVKLQQVSRWRAGCYSPDKTLCIVAGEFVKANEDLMKASGAVVITKEDAAAQAAAWEEARPADPARKVGK